MMNDRAPPRLRTPAGLIATFFGVGLLPRAPGTWGSLAALPFAWLIQQYLGRDALALAIILLFAAGCWAAGRHAATLGGGDPGEVVIDEVAGQWLTLLFVPADWRLYALGFVLFRLADILKPWPVNLADQAIGGGLGIMIDDVLAAGYAMAGLYVAGLLLGV